ncbi:hypothetical protein O3P69_011183 [Scylla paramamosain]|uniref:Uncharacterized protein n=1 Tax=Scylla paramamosain TaxID=85552 RepID=A0AAW0SW77_SCYPA
MFEHYPRKTKRQETLQLKGQRGETQVVIHTWKHWLASIVRLFERGTRHCSPLGTLTINSSLKPRVINIPRPRQGMQGRYRDSQL